MVDERRSSEYIWHCPNKECREKGIVILKTFSPLLPDGRIRCSRCGNEYCFFEIMRANRRNLENFLESLESF